MKILVLMNGRWTSVGGGDIHLLEVCKRLTAAGIDITFMNPDDTEFNDSLKLLKHITYADSNKMGKGKDCKGFISISKLYWKRQRAIKKYMKHHKEEMKQYTHIIIGGPFLYDLWPAVYLKKYINPKCKLILYWHHTTTPGKGLRYRLAKLQETNAIKNVKKYVDIIITSNIIEQEKLKKLTDKPVMLTSHGIDWKNINNKNIFKEPLSACFVGRLEKSKGVWDLLAAWERIIYDPFHEFSDAVLHIIGSGMEEEALKETVNKMGLKNNVIFHGYVSDKEKYRILLDSRLFLFPSYQEGFGICLIEALACGCEVIAFELKHYKSIFGDKIQTVPIGGWQKMAGGAVKSFNSLIDKKKINDQVNWCRAMFNWNQVAKDNYKIWMNEDEHQQARANEPKSL